MLLYLCLSSVLGNHLEGLWSVQQAAQQAVAWPDVVQSLIQTAQTIVLAWLASEQYQSRQERQRRQRDEGVEVK